nr:lactadherin-like [Pocillopora verrucosa]
MENGNIHNDQLSASSQFFAHGVTRGRLNLLSSPGAWVCRTVDRYQWLQVDLRSQDISVTGLATQGRNDWNQWVIQYNVQYSYDGDDFKYYTENGQSPKEFSGNVDRNTVVYHDLVPPIKARYIRFRPSVWRGRVSMRVELYTCIEEKNECTAPAVGIETGEILDSQLSASSGDPSNARLNGAKTWCRTWPGSESENVYVQIDFGRSYRICAVATRGDHPGSHSYLEEYKLRWSHDGVKWEESPEVLEGNSNTHEVKKNIIPVIQARYVRLIPLKWHNWTCARMEFYGEPWPEVLEALFMPRFGPDKVQAGQVITSRSVSDVMQCMKLCLVTDQCQSLNFSSSLKKCEVSRSKSEMSSIEDREGFHYYEIVAVEVISI